jgi:hypothetical protein
MKLELPWQIFERKILKYQISQQKNPSSVSRLRPNRHDEVNSRFSKFWPNALARTSGPPSRLQYC